MAGIPWIVVFVGLAWFSLRRGHHPLIGGLWVFCIGVIGANTSVGNAIYGATTGFLGGGWHAVVGLFNGVA
jgi:hypothetical protein